MPFLRRKEPAVSAMVRVSYSATCYCSIEPHERRLLESEMEVLEIRNSGLRTVCEQYAKVRGQYMAVVK